MATELCPKCGSTETTFNQTYGFWICNKCKETWAHDEDDPDYDEIDDEEDTDIIV